MSLEHGLAAMNLQMPPRVPRTEYSVTEHWALITRVTGIEVTHASPGDVKSRAAQALMKAWQFDFAWSTLIGSGEFKEMRTRMGHAVYADGGVDFDTDIRSPFREPEDVLAFDPWDAFGPIDKPATARRFEEHYQANCRQCPDMVNMTGVYTTCISGLIDLFGWELLLLAAGVDRKGFGDLANRYASWILQYYEALADADVPVIMSHDDIVWTSGPFLPPQWYRQYVFPNYKRYFAPLIASGKKIIYTSDGDYTAFIDDIAACGVHGFVLEPLTDMAYIAARYGRTHAFIGNVDTRVLLMGKRPQIRAEVERCMAIGKSCPGFFLAVGNHIPPNTPVDNCLYYNEVYEELSRR
jgi:hypothetical protein